MEDEMTERGFDGGDEEVRRFDFQFVFEWGEWLWGRKHMNWKNFKFVAVEMEHETCMFNIWTFTFAVLGIGFVFVRRGVTPTREMAQAMARVDQISAGLRDGKTPKEIALTRVCPECFHPLDEE
jgi:hypothetical protein